MAAVPGTAPGGTYFMLLRYDTRAIFVSKAYKIGYRGSLARTSLARASLARASLASASLASASLARASLASASLARASLSLARASLASNMRPDSFECGTVWGRALQTCHNPHNLTNAYKLVSSS